MTRVLLVRLSAMGDVVESLGAVRSLQQARPGFELHFVTQCGYAPLLEGFVGLESVIGHDRGGGAGAWLRTRRCLRALRCDVAIDLQGNFKSACCAWLSGAPRRIGAARAARREPASAFLLNDRVAIVGAAHPAAVAIQLIWRLAPEAVAAAPALTADPLQMQRMAAAVAAAGINPGRPFRVVVLGDPADPRSQRPAALRRELSGGELPTLLLVGPAEARVSVPQGAACLRQERGDLRGLIALGALVAAAKGEVVGPDQGAVHVLAATGARTVCLFGPQDPQRTAPSSAEVRVHPQAPPCQPCRRRRCRHAEGPVCMDFTVGEGVESAGSHWLRPGRS